MKKVVSVLLSLALCLCFLAASMGNKPNGSSTPNDPDLTTVEPETPEEPVQPMNDDGPGDRNEDI